MWDRSCGASCSLRMGTRLARRTERQVSKRYLRRTYYNSRVSGLGERGLDLGKGLGLGTIHSIWHGFLSI